MWAIAQNRFASRNQHCVLGPKNVVSDPIRNVERLRLLQPCDSRVSHHEIGIVGPHGRIALDRITQLTGRPGSAGNHRIGIESLDRGRIVGRGTVTDGVKRQIKRFGGRVEREWSNAIRRTNPGGCQKSGQKKRIHEQHRDRSQATADIGAGRIRPKCLNLPHCPLCAGYPVASTSPTVLRQGEGHISSPEFSVPVGRDPLAST